MKSIKLQGKAYDLAKEFCATCNDLAAKKKVLETQIEELQKVGNDEMKRHLKAIKSELGLDEKVGLQVDATYLDEHGDCYALIFEVENDADAHPLTEFLNTDKPSTLN